MMIGDVSYAPLVKMNDLEKGQSIRLTICSACGAVVAEVSQGIHSRWHKVNSIGLG